MKDLFEQRNGSEAIERELTKIRMLLDSSEIYEKVPLLPDTDSITTTVERPDQTRRH